MATSFWSKINPLNWAKEVVLNYGIRTLFERVPVISKALSYLDGKKEAVGKIIWAIGLSLQAIKTQFPELPISVTDANITFVVGFIIDLIGQAHAYDKSARGLPRTPEKANEAPKAETAQADEEVK